MKNFFKVILHFLFWPFRKKMLMENDLSGKNLNILDHVILGVQNKKVSESIISMMDYDPAKIWNSESGDNFWRCEAHHSNLEMYNDDKIYRKPFLGALLFLIVDNNIKNVIEFGCGRGDNLAYLSSKHYNCRYLGIDANQSVIKTAKMRYPNLEFKQGDVLKIIEDKNIFKSGMAIFTCAVLMYFNEKNITDLLIRLPKNTFFSINEVFTEEILNSEKSLVHSLYSFYHDYEKIFCDCGYKMINKSIRKTHNDKTY